MNNPASPHAKMARRRSGAADITQKRQEKSLIGLCRVTH
jgi:hypothetical protein